MNKILIDWGMDPKVADRFDETIIAILMIAIAVVLNYLCQAILVGGMKQYTRRKPHLWNTLLMKHKVFHNLIHTIPAILVYALLPMAFMRGKELLLISQKACAIYIIFSLLLAINGILLMIMDIYDGKETMKNRPMKGFIQVLQVLLFFIGGIVIIAIIVNKSPASLFAGLGASAAILMLVFKDSILGFVAGIQLSANDMLKLGDWLEMPKYGADGAVIDIGLTTVKVRNWDNTITTIPTWSLVSDSFKNWSGMSASGGRRIKRSISIDVTSIRFLDEDEMQRLNKAHLLKPYLTSRHQEINEWNRQQGSTESILNLRRMTNIGTFRAYLNEYLRNHPRIRKDMTLMVRQLAPGDNGLPLEIYAFTNTVVWLEYESIQADIFDHIFAIVEEFGLRLHQSPTGNDIRSLAGAFKQ